MKQKYSKLRRVARWAGFVVVGLLVLPLMPVVTGLTWDVFGQLWILPFGIRSVYYFHTPENVAYHKPWYRTEMIEGNAWSQYSQIVNALDRENWDRVDPLLRNFGQGDYNDTARAVAELAKYDSILSLIGEGARRTTCAVFMDYWKGVDVEDEHMFPLGRGTRLLALRADLSMSRDTDLALKDLLDGLVFCEDIAGGQLTIRGYGFWMGLQHRFTSRIDKALAEFRLNRRQLEVVASSMNLLADYEPSPLRNLNAYPRLAAISLARLPLLAVFLHRPWAVGEETIGFWWFSHLFSYRWLFSDKLSLLSGIRAQRRAVERLVLTEEEGWNALDSLLNRWLVGVKASSNPAHLEFLGDFWCGGRYAYLRQFMSLARLRVAGAAALVELYFLDNREWPDRLPSVKADGLDDLLIDPFTDRHLTYIVHPGGDSVSIYSVGPNMVDDGGLRGNDKDDLAIVLHRPQH